MSKSDRSRGIFDYAPKAAARNRALLPPEEDAEPGFFSAGLEDVYKKKYGGRYPGLAENVASGAATGLKAIGVPKHVAETTGRNIARLGEDWTGFGTLTAAEHLPEAIRSYMSGTKDIDEVTGEPLGLQPVRPLPSASRAGYFGIPLAVGAGAGAGVLAGGGGEAEAAPAAPTPRSPIAALDQRVMDEAYATRSSPRDVLKRMLGLP